MNRAIAFGSSATVAAIVGLIALRAPAQEVCHGIVSTPGLVSARCLSGNGGDEAVGTAASNLITVELISGNIVATFDLLDENGQIIPGCTAADGTLDDGPSGTLGCSRFSDARSWQLRVE